MSPLIRRILDRADVATQPHLVWNAFVDLVALEDYKALSPKQRVAHVAFWYDAEVQNGGHIQYFENSAGEHAVEAIGAIEQIGGAHLASILRLALERRQSRPREPITSVGEFVEASLQQEFRDLDERYFVASPSMFDLLQAYLHEHENEFIDYSPAG